MKTKTVVGINLIVPGCVVPACSGITFTTP